MTKSMTSHSKTLRRAGAVAVLAGSVLLPACAFDASEFDEGTVAGETVDSTEQAVAPGDVAGWATYDSQSHTLYASKSFNSSGGAITVNEFAKGSYSVDFAGLGGSSKSMGNVQVTSVGKSADRCKVMQWYSLGTTLRVNVRCHFAGSPNNATFLVSYARFAGGQTVSPDGAYMLYNMPVSGELPATYQWGAVSTVESTTTGVYTVRFAGQTEQDAGMIVTALGTDPTYCKVTNWYPSGSDTLVGVRCFDDDGNLVNSRFTLRVVRTVRDSWGQSGGYVWAHSPTTTDYTPVLSYQRNEGNSECGTFESVNTVHRKYTGGYTVNYPRLAGGAAAFATAYGSSSDYCKPEWWNDALDHGSLNVEVRCFGNNGILKNSMYDQVLFSNWYGIC